jgi:hypothetical protein
MKGQPSMKGRGVNKVGCASQQHAGYEVGGTPPRLTASISQFSRIGFG